MYLGLEGIKGGGGKQGNVHNTVVPNAAIGYDGFR
jgi:hypothetical protein